jgi:hypothetical protein
MKSPNSSKSLVLVAAAALLLPISALAAPSKGPADELVAKAFRVFGDDDNGGDSAGRRAERRPRSGAKKRARSKPKVGRKAPATAAPDTGILELIQPVAAARVKARGQRISSPVENPLTASPQTNARPAEEVCK